MPGLKCNLCPSLNRENTINPLLWKSALCYRAGRLVNSVSAVRSAQQESRGNYRSSSCRNCPTIVCHIGYYSSLDVVQLSSGGFRLALTYEFTHIEGNHGCQDAEDGDHHQQLDEIGRASCRERV